jgi:hypothetical protein
MWFVRPQLFFHCTLRPMGTVAGSYNSSEEDIQLELVFFSPFEELRLRTAGIMETKGIHRVYTPSPVPMLYVGRVDDLLSRVPLIPYFLSGTLLSTAVPMVRALPRGGAAMFTRSTPGCRTLDSPSLAWAALLWPRLRRS